MRRAIGIALILALLCGMIGATRGETWQEFAEKIEKNCESQIKLVRAEYKEHGDLSKRDIEILYRYYQLWISAKQIKLLAMWDFKNIPLESDEDPFATGQKLAAEMWQMYLDEKIGASLMAKLLINMTNEIEQ